MAEIDPGAIQNLFGGIKTVGDYNQANQQFLTNQGLQAQTLNNAKLTGQTQANTLATQILSAAASTGDQAAWDQGKATLQNMGIDTSMWAPDVKSGATQVTAAKLAQSPLGPLLDAAAKQQQANATTAGVTGNAPPATPMLPGPLGAAIAGFQNGGAPGAAASMAIAPGGIANPAPAATPTLPTPSAAMSAPAAGANGFLPPVNPNPMVNNVLNNATNTAPNLTNTPAQAPTAGIANVPAQVAGVTASGGAPAAAAPLGAIQPTSPLPTPTPGIATQGFVPPPYDSTKTMQANNIAFEQAQKAYESDPNVIASRAQLAASGSQMGSAMGDLAKTYNVMQANLPVVINRINEIKGYAAGASSGFGVNDTGTGWGQQIADQFSDPNNPNSKSMNNNMLLSKVAQGIIPEMGPQLQANGVKANKFLESLISSAGGINMAAPSNVKDAQADGLLVNYVNQLKSASAQLRAQGLPAATDDQINQYVQQVSSKIGTVANPVTTQAVPPPTNAAAAAPTTPAFGEGAVIQMPDGSKQLFVNGAFRPM